ncbi:MAG: nucleotidyltransferase domain-containing protein [Acetatifactor sp.]|nr:nucleotidyltransferase domain-containing protein [Acetatifactor sp.]
MTRLEERNQKIIDAIITKAKRVCPESLALIGVYGSFLTGDIYLKSDLDLLILINDDSGWQLGSTFIQEDEMVGHDLYCTNWESLKDDAQYNHPNISKLMDSRIVYCADKKYLERLENLRESVKEKLAAPLTAQDYDKSLKYLEEAYHYMRIAKHSANKAKVLEGIGAAIYYLENAVAMLNKRFFRLGVKRAYEELNGMEKKPDMFCDLIEKVISAPTVDEAKEGLIFLIKETTEIFVKEGLRLGKTVCVQDILEEKNETIFEDNESQNYDDRKAATVYALEGTYEEMFSNWRNKMYLAAETGNSHLAFMSLISFNAMLTEISNEWRIGDYNPLSGYNPADLYATAQAFDNTLKEYLEEYRKIGLEINCYSNIDAFVCDYLQS